MCRGYEEAKEVGFNTIVVSVESTVLQDGLAQTKFQYNSCFGGMIIG